jgi:hypothetical protein
VRTAKHPEQDFAIPLVNRVKARGFDVQTAIMDKGYDVEWSTTGAWSAT